MKILKLIKELYSTSVGKLLLIMIIVFLVLIAGAVYLSITNPSFNPFNPFPPENPHMSPF